QNKQMRWYLKIDQSLRKECADFWCCRYCPSAKDDSSANLLPQLGLGHRETDRLSHCGVREEYIFYFTRGDLLAAAVDQLFDPSSDIQVALGIQVALVPCSQPVIPNSGDLRPTSIRAACVVCVVEISRRHVCPANDYLALNSCLHRTPLFVHDGHLRPRRTAN